MERVWLKEYPKHIGANINESSFSKLNSINDLVKETKKYSNDTAFVNLNSSLTYQEVNEYSNRFSSFLQSELHIQKSSKVAIMLPNLLTFPVTIFGIFKAGGIAVNINPLYKSREIINVLTDSQAETIVVLDKFLPELEPVISKSKIKNIIVCKPTNLLSPIMKIIVGIVLFFKNDKTPNKINYINFSTTIKKRHNTFNEKITRDDIALLQYTGGTTGKSKAAVLTHGNLLSNIEQLHSWVKEEVTYRKETIITALPLYHIFSLTVNLFYFYYIGSKNVLITNPRDLKSFVKTLSKYKFTIITAVNTLFNLLMTSSTFKKIDFTNLKFAIGGGMAVLKTTAIKWKKITGVEITQGYGLTETSPIISVNKISEPFNGTIGLPMPSTDISLRNDNNEEVNIGEEGELCVKGPQVMKEYWNNQTETNKSFTSDGFFKTGDIATINKKGYLTIVDRKKDMIISSGFNVYPNEIEEYVSTHKDVLECGVIGKEDSNRGESIILYVVRLNDAILESDIINYCKEGLTVYKIPKKVIFIKELPKNNVGKILRRKLREL
ncbi:MAG: long-chain-fatty-acid--CoA ligase [Gammaproteobacteria bacterium]|nr:long-chain-fatty-acid--CoA ligase [Gammaproteobacteria bacterium]